MKRLQVWQIRSTIGRPEKHRRIMKSLGLGKLHRRVEHRASPQILGMLTKVRHLVEWRELES